jgi:glycine/D-amino acid oxidase-like deaminating enzyme
MRVCVIGAGPAGLSAASELAARGAEVVVLEKEPGVGGKCRSVTVGDRPYDLGANLTTPRYVHIRALAARLGLHQRAIAPRQLRNVDAPQEEHVSPLVDAGPLERVMVRGGAGLYVALRELTGIDRDGYAGLPPGVREPFGEWLSRHGLAALRPLFANLFVAYGYGVMDELPAAYALKFFDSVHLDAAVDVLLGEPVSGTTDWKEGFQALWERLVADEGLDVRREATVTAVNRSPAGVRVAWSTPEGAREEAFDRLVVACPLPAALGFLDASPDERRLFGKIRTYDYYVTAASTSGLPPISTYVLPYCQRVEPGQPTVFYRPYADDPDNVFLFYAYGDAGTTVEQVHANLRRVAGRFGGTIGEIHATQHWRYFPHVDSEAMTAGFYDELEALQGRWHTWFVGEILSFTLVELSARYARNVAERITG